MCTEPRASPHRLRRRKTHQGTGGAAGKAGARNRTENEAQQRESGTGRRTRHSRRFEAKRRQARSCRRARKRREQGDGSANTKKDSRRRSRLLCLVRSCVPLSACCALFGVAFRFPFAVPCSELRSAPPLFPPRLPFLGVFALANAQPVRGSSRRSCCL